VLGDDVVEAIVHDTLHTVPEDGSACWSTRSMAARYGIGKDTVARIWQARRIRPWKVETFKLSTGTDRLGSDMVDLSRWMQMRGPNRSG
jgi:hypothetical protein